MTTHALMTLPLTRDQDLVVARQRAREISALLGFAAQDQIRIATTVSEIARNALRYAAGGQVAFEVASLPAWPRALAIRVSDQGPGIPDLDAVLGGRYVSRTGMGQGIVGAMRLMDEVDIQTAAGQGTTVTLIKALPADAAPITPARIAELVSQLGHARESSSLDELQRQNSELVSTLAALRERQEELVRLTRELEDTNRGVVALYAELDEHAERLRRADDMKSRFLSNMSHEFRTPLSSMRALTRLLMSGVDGRLTLEQAKQVGFIDTAARELTDLVNDLLDLAKIEAGMEVVRAAPFELADLFSAMRGMLKPLLVSEAVDLVFEEATHLPTVVSDESKISQILRNFISNALKFTPRGEVRVSACLSATQPGYLELSVSDTGIGVAPEQIELIFEEFTQVENELQRAYKGTGLGLPLCRRLAGLLGGAIRVKSAPGQGSCFTVILPSSHPMSETSGSTLRSAPVLTEPL
ncbi:MAG: histidine kinase [Rubrivivax sp.]|nr:MAG: histidine kinase [Rubrivivax sp.]